VFLISAFCGSSSSANIKCRYDDSVYSIVGEIYECSFKRVPKNLAEKSVEISNIRGTHKGSKSNDDVTGIYAKDITFHFFPKGLDNFFKNIKLIVIESCELKEIHQADLKPFAKLIYLSLYYNQIEVIEEGLFDFNPNLEFLWFYETKVIHIDPKVFDHLNNLKGFWFYEVPCIHLDVDNSREKVIEAIKIVKLNCTNSEVMSIENQI